MLHDFKEWSNYKEIGQPKIGDLIISRPSAIFNSQQTKNGWTKTKKSRDLYNPNLPTYMIDNDYKSYMNADGSPGRKYLARIFSGSTKRNKRQIFIDGNELSDIPSTFSDEEREGRNVWLWIKPNSSKSSKYLNIYNQWSQEKEPDKSNERFWKLQFGESKIYNSYPIIEE